MEKIIEECNIQSEKVIFLKTGPTEILAFSKKIRATLV